MKSLKNYRSAFSLLELIFVIVILGIISSIGAEIIAKVYESYIVQRAQYRSGMKTELALNQIANRLRYKINGSIVFRTSKTSAIITTGSSNTGNDKVLQWVAYDGDSFEAIDCDSDRRPGWSGFCDIDAYISGSTSLPTPGSHIDLADEIIGNLGGDISNAVIYFPHQLGQELNISGGGGESITLDSAIPSGFRLYEQYKLAWTSYALEVDGNNDLILHYNFSPVVGAAIAGNSSVLLKNVTNFRFDAGEGSIRIKICKEEKIGAEANATVHACKEKVIL